MGKAPSRMLWGVCLGYVFFNTWLFFFSSPIPLNTELLGVPIQSPDILPMISAGWAGVAIGMLFAEFTRRKEP